MEQLTAPVQALLDHAAALLAAAPQAAGWYTAVTRLLFPVLAVLILAVFLYMRNKSHIRSLSLHGLVPSVLVGVFLGVCSSFLGIGGGPINVALIIYLFGYDTKSATVCSIVTILFSQISKLSSVALTTGFAFLKRY